MRPDATTPPSKRCTKCGQFLPATPGFFSKDRSAKDGMQHYCRECMKEHARRWHRSHSKEAAETNRRWMLEHKDERLVYDAQRRIDDPEYAARYRAEHRDERLAYNRRYYEEHKEERKAYGRKHSAEHPDERRSYTRNRRARLREAQGSHTGADIAAQRTRQRGLCYWCGDRVGRHYHVDHVVPIISGGSNGPENLVITCASCNQRKGATHPMDWAGCMF